MNSTPKTFAIVPAAGQSRRMGQPKLLLPWGERRMIDCVLDAWSGSRVDETYIVVRADDEPLITACQAWPVRIVLASSPPADMKASICLGLDQIAREHHPNELAQFFIAPADLPELNTHLINQLLAMSQAEQSIVAPQFGQKIGHPILMRWMMAQQIRDLPDSLGIDSLLKSNPVHRVSFPKHQRIKDIDTKVEYDRAKPTSSAENDSA